MTSENVYRGSQPTTTTSTIKLDRTWSVTAADIFADANRLAELGAGVESFLANFEVEELETIVEKCLEERTLMGFTPMSILLPAAAALLIEKEGK